MKIPGIHKEKTGRRIRLLMKLRGVSVEEVRAYLSLGCVQSVYHWLDGRSLPSLDNLYALSELLCIPMDFLVCGDRKKIFEQRSSGVERLLCYYFCIKKPKAA